MSRESRICGKRERRIPGFLADFLIDEKILKNTRPKASSSTPASTKHYHRRLQSSALSQITTYSGLSTYSKRAKLKKYIRIDKLNGGNKGSEEAVDVAIEPRYIRECAAGCQRYFCRQDTRSETGSDYEMEFYYADNEKQAQVALPTLSHRDMCRPPYEDPDYQKQLVASYRRGLLSTVKNENARPISNPVPLSSSNSYSTKHRLSLAESRASGPRRRAQTLSQKCQKVYGRDQRELWCAQCRWKKACTRFGDD